ncbi:MAG TPA: TAXI family TRAP transporter solute-binding subunit [Hyphomicrobiaceae bacterium]|nr:TAXI family TRAP transporter solute-binding subunit [Hyphomicrobiaceae bacterium]
MRRHMLQLGAALGLAALSLTSSVALAQDRLAVFKESLRSKANAHTVGVASGNPNGAYLYLAYDLSAVFDSEALRVIAVVGKGGQQNVKDALYLRGIDLAITQANVLKHFKRTGELGSDIDKRLVYITRLYTEEMHVVVHQKSGVASLQELAGKTVNFSDAGSGTQLSARVLFQLLGLNVKEINVGQADALRMLAAGEIAATVLVAGKPAGAFGRLAADSGYRILPIPYTQAMEDADFLPIRLSRTDYAIIPDGQPVDSLGVSAVLAAYNWPKSSDRYARIERFINELFTRLAELQKPPRHPKWKDVNLSATLPGWTRHPAAQSWLDRQR